MLGKIRQGIKNFLSRVSANIPGDTLRIIGFEGSPEQKNTKIRYQICGKSVVSQELLRTLVPELVRIRGFSPADSHQLFTLFVAEYQAPSFKIRSVIFSEDEDEFEIEHLQESYLFTTTAASLFETPEILREFSHTEALMIQKSFSDKLQKSERQSIKDRSLSHSRGNFHVIKN